MIKTGGKKGIYFLITIPILITLMILAINLFVRSCRKTVLFAEFHSADSDTKTYYRVKTDGNCGKCESDIWGFYNEDNKLVEKASAPLRSKYIIFYEIHFNPGHYDVSTNTSIFGKTYEEIVEYVKTHKTFTYKHKGLAGYWVCEEETSPNGNILYLIGWCIFATIVIFIPFILLPISKEDTKRFIKAAKFYLRSGNKYYCLSITNDNNGDTIHKIELNFSRINDGELEIKVDIHYMREHVIYYESIYTNGNKLNMYRLNSSEKAWFKWFINNYLDTFYTYAVEKNAEKIFKES